MLKREPSLFLKGFTLVELLLAVAILAFAIIGTLSLFANCALLNDANRGTSIAASHAQFVMEDMKNWNFASLQTNIGSGNWNWDSATINSKGLNALNSEVINTQSSGTNPLGVTVTVTWQDRGQRNRSLALETLISN